MLTRAQHPKSILIAGGGIGGLCAASLLAQAGHTVSLFEQSPKFEEVGAGIQLSPNAMQVLHIMGVSDAITACAFKPEFAVLRDYKTGYSLYKTALGEQMTARYGQPYLHIHRAELIDILELSARENGVKFHLSHKVGHYKDKNTHIELDTNQGLYKGDMLIGADGVKSTICERLHSDNTDKFKGRFTGQIAWRGTIPASALRSGTLPPAASVWLGPESHFVAYYIRNGQLVNFVAVKEKQNWTAQSWHEAANMSELRNNFKGWDKTVTDILEACEQAYLWGLFERPPLPFWSKGRTALLGDSAHAMLPFMAQGAAMAIEDSWVLHRMINDNKNTLTALNKYEKARLRRCTKLQNISKNNAQLYHASSNLDRMMRNLKLSLARHIPQLSTQRLDYIYGYDVTQI